MKLHVVTAACAIALLVGGVSERAVAQGPYVRPQPFNPYRRPTISPYLNLARGGSPAINYYGLVRPQIQTQAALNQVQQQLLDQQTQLNQQQYGLTSGVPITGRPAGFMNHYGYFQNWQNRGAGGAGLPGGLNTGLGGAPGTGVAGAAVGIGAFPGAGVNPPAVGTTMPRTGGATTRPGGTPPRPPMRPMNPEE